MVRHYRKADRNSVIALWNTAFPNPAPHNEPARVIDEKLAKDDLLFVAEIENKVVGTCMAGYDGHRGWLYTVAVMPERRRQGVGRALVEYATKNLMQLGCSKINLQIRSDNVEVISFYRSLGFQIEDRISMGLMIPIAEINEETT